RCVIWGCAVSICRSACGSSMSRDGSVGRELVLPFEERYCSWGPLLRSSKRASRDIAGCLLFLRQGHFDLAELELPVEMGKFPSRVFEEELTLQEQDRSKDIEEQDSSGGQNRVSVLAEKHALVRGHELQLVHEPEP